jgi:phosphoglycerate dehydrogenase-like enzyme
MKIYICFPSWKNDNLLNALRKKAEIVIAETRPNQAELKKIAQEYDGIIIGIRNIINEEILSDSKLKFIASVTKGTNHIDAEACKKHNVAVFYAPKANISSVAEYIMASILVHSKSLFQLDKKMRKGPFDRYLIPTIDIKDKVLGIIGAGAISKELITRAKAFGMIIFCYTFHPEKHSNLDVEFVSLPVLLKNSDFVSVSIALSDKTKNLIGAQELSIMKKSAYLINASRGGIINENDLIDALKNKQIAGAGIDTFENEPNVNKEFYNLENLIMTPHIAGLSLDARDRWERHLVDDIIAFLQNEPTKFRLC